MENKQFITLAMAAWQIKAWERLVLNWDKHKHFGLLIKQQNTAEPIDNAALFLWRGAYLELKGYFVRKFKETMSLGLVMLSGPVKNQTIVITLLKS
jgi:hypothetical protein